MKNILADLVSLAGINYGYIYKDQRVLATTFPDVLQDKLAKVGHMIEQMFMTVDAIGQSHDEVHFELDDNFFIAYRVDSDLLVVLLTEKKLNLPLVHMTIKSAVKKIKALATEAPSVAPAPVAAVAPPEMPATPVAKPSAISLETKEKMNQILAVLIEYLGPAASIVFDDVKQLWQRNFSPTQDNLIELVKLLMQELDEKSEQKSFLKNASRVIQ